MKTFKLIRPVSVLENLLYVILLLLFSVELCATNMNVNQIQQSEKYKQYSGSVVDIQTNEALVFASITVVNTNISTITNSDGEFLLKIPNGLSAAEITVAMLGYKKKIMPVLQLKKKNNIIGLVAAVTKLSEVELNLPKDAKSLVRTMFSKRKENYLNQKVLMTAFYRESIKKRQRNVSLAEAITNVYMQPYTSSRSDKVELFKMRKSTDYSRLDTIAFKLQGGPYNALRVDIIKYPEYIFTPDSFDDYHFSFAPSIYEGSKILYVVKFEQKAFVKEPLHFGKLYIDASTGALTSAIFNLNVTDKKMASELFVKKQPKGIFAYPTAVSYRVDYKERDGKWYYSYGNAQLVFKIKKKGKWFNTNYSINSEMAVTDWKLNTSGELPPYKDRMKKSIIITDEASGFTDTEFWGAYNVIEPDKSIESAIKKIKKQLDN